MCWKVGHKLNQQLRSLHFHFFLCRYIFFLARFFLSSAIKQLISFEENKRKRFNNAACIGQVVAINFSFVVSKFATINMWERNFCFHLFGKALKYLAFNKLFFLWSLEACMYGVCKKLSCLVNFLFFAGGLMFSLGGFLLFLGVSWFGISWYWFEPEKYFKMGFLNHPVTPHHNQSRTQIQFYGTRFHQDTKKF